MEILSGSLYFVSDDFFAKIQDPYLKVNYEDTKRPHCFAFKDSKTGLYWLIPCSSKIKKILFVNLQFISFPAAPVCLPLRMLISQPAR